MNTAIGSTLKDIRPRPSATDYTLQMKAAIANDTVFLVRDSAAGADWKRAHDALVRLAKQRAGLDFEEGRSLLAALRSRAHMKLGYGMFYEYVERLFGYSPRLTSEKLRVAEALELLPEMAQALKDGEVCWSGLREVTRVVTPRTEKRVAPSRAGPNREADRAARIGPQAWGQAR